MPTQCAASFDNLRVVPKAHLRFVDLGADFYEHRVNTERRTRDLVRQLMALGHQVTLSSAA